MLSLGLGYDPVSDPRDNLIMLCLCYASCLWIIRDDFIIVASNPLNCCYSKIDMLFECLFYKYSTFVDNIKYFAISI